MAVGWLRIAFNLTQRSKDETTRPTYQQGMDWDRSGVGRLGSGVDGLCTVQRHGG